jgi:hypothetical protein
MDTVTAAARPAAPSPAACINCGTTLQGRWCHACGQRAHTPRLTLPALAHEVPHAVLHVDRGIVPTVVGMLRRPGQTINRYLDGQRARYFNPLTLLVLAAGLSALLYSAYPFQLAIESPALDPRLAGRYAEFMRLNFKYYSLSLIFFLPATALITWCFFAGRGRAYGEHVVINTFILAMTTLIMIAAFPLLVSADRLGGLRLTWVAMSAAAMVYHLVALYAVFAASGSRLWTALRALASVALYIVTVSVVPMLLFFLLYARG